MVAADPAHCFEAFTLGLSDWWDPRLTADATTFSGAEIPPGPGGEAVFRHSDGLSYPIGTVSEWRPGERFAMSFVLSLDPAHPTALVVEFERIEDGTLVRLTHSGWGPENVSERGKFSEWPQLLERYRRHTTGSS
jgi:hypothetical protein